MKACANPLPWERLVEYWAGDLDEAATDAVDEHLFSCEPCSTESARVARIAQAFRSQLPVVVTSAQLAELKARGLVVEENEFTPGTRRAVTFERHVDLLVHHLVGLDLADVERVHLFVKSESRDEVLFEDPFAPFDRARGEILVACQRHFGMLPPDVVFDVRAIRAKSPPTTARFVVPHLFAGGGVSG